ncbi:MAG: sigma-70 family RNA polymerase sigma factor [Candidatus Hydrogenedentes bacterium]|nr:sigma-70 family RNA polymerase sigma factor [Candidatus Hydrogenedentota bacterium]
MLKVREGDECAFAELFRRYQRRLLDFFYGMNRDAQLAEDLCLETFARVWHLRRKYAATGSFPAYLFTFARNIWLEKCRYLGKQWRLGSAQSVEADGPDLPAAVSTHPDEMASRSELEERILEAVAGLPEEQRMVFVMRTIQRLSLEEIAAVLQCPVNTVRSRKLLAVKKLRESLRGLLVL